MILALMSCSDIREKHTHKKKLRRKTKEDDGLENCQIILETMASSGVSIFH